VVKSDALVISLALAIGMGCVGGGEIACRILTVDHSLANELEVGAAAARKGEDPVTHFGDLWI
jgi:hypothetical protein